LVIVGFWCFRTYRPIAAPSVGFGVGRLLFAFHFFTLIQCVAGKDQQIAYLQMLGTLVDFSTYDAEANAR